MKSDIENNFPSYANTTGIKWMMYEAIDHLWPWSKQGWQHHKAIQSTGFVIAATATVVWALAANGQLGASVVIGWWLGWSVYEIIIRLQCKPYIKDGPWWGHLYRSARLMDMICYVMFKNLLIGAILFIVLRNFGLLQMVN